MYMYAGGKSRGNRPRGKWRRRWEDNIKKSVKEMGYEDGSLKEVAQDLAQWQASLLAVLNLKVLPSS
jgi:hypothetical protein